MSNNESVKAMHERYAVRKPGRAARMLADTEAALARETFAAKVERLTAVVDGLRSGLDKVGRCWRCGRELTDPESVARHLGPDCFESLVGAR